MIFINLPKPAKNATVDHILFGSPESTMRQPNRMNNLYTPHAAPREHEVFSRDAVPLDVLPHWTIVFAVRCPNEASVSLLDMLEKLVQFAIPDGVRFEVYIYEVSNLVIFMFLKYTFQLL